MSADCTVCSTPTADAFLCDTCWADLAVDLNDLAGYRTNDRGEKLIPLIVELDVELSRQERQARSTVMVSGTPDRPLPVNLKAGQVRDHLHAVLHHWVRQVARVRAIDPDPVDTVVTNAQWLLRHRRAVRAFHDVEQLVAGVTSAVERARRVIDNRSLRIYVGECGAVDAEDGYVCTQPLWADSAYALCRCTFCGASWASMERWEQYVGKVKAERQAQVAGMHLGARRMAAVLTALGMRIDESTVRKYARTGRVVSTGVDQQGRKVYLAGDVMALLSVPVAA